MTTLRVALAQVDPLIGDLEGNASKIRQASVSAASQGARLVVFPELALVGYPPLDLLAEPAFLERAFAAVTDLAAALGREAPGADVVFGAVLPALGATGKRLRNVAVLARDGNVAEVRGKTLLPSYDVFDEDRWFQPSTGNAPVEHLGVRLGITVCEDLWNDELYWSHRIYETDPIEDLATSGADLLVNLSASPYHRGKARGREEMMRASVVRHGLPLLFVNQVGGNDELIFDGTSAALDASGRVLARAARFREDLVVLDVDVGRPRHDIGASAPVEDLPSSEPPRDLRSALVLGIRDYVEKTGFPGVLIGLSGGIDSSVVAALAAEALGPSRVEGVLMPSRFSSEGSVTDALDLASRLGLKTRTVPIEPIHSSTLEALAPHFAGTTPGTAEENVQARIRGLLLMALSNKHGKLVLSTGNKSELAVGYCTLYGDMNGGLAVLGDCYKGWVFELASDFNRSRDVIPAAVIEKPPSAELRPGQRDSDSLPPYPLLDRILEGLVERRRTAEQLAAEGLPSDLVRAIAQRVDDNEYKRRQSPPILRVTQRAFGQGRRLPLARGRRGLARIIH